MNRMVSEAQIAKYRRDGFIVVPGLLDKAELGAIRAVIAELVAGAARVDKHDDVYDLEPGHTRQIPRVRRIKTPHKVHAVFEQAIRSPR
ncbi:MAG: hypothetical protein JO122_13440 [Acetobacteraceae bacterium]|nr:hypothetical protein [Acetobacteraceae bacterium]